MKKALFSVALTFCLSAMNLNAQPPLENYFAPASKEAATPDSEGFIRRWTLLEPISKPNRSNTVFTDSYLREAFAVEYFKNQFTMVPKDGQKVKAKAQIEVRQAMPAAPAPGAGAPNRPAGPGAGSNRPAGPGAGPGAGMPPMGGFRGMGPAQLKDTVVTLTWHKYDSKLYNNKLFRFASGLKKQVYGNLFWAVTTIECDEDITGIRMAVGSNSASMWWLNGEEAVLLSGDRRMVADDVISDRLTLKKGKNIVRGVVINGPGMSDFCLRFIDEKGNPVKGIRIL